MQVMKSDERAADYWAIVKRDWEYEPFSQPVSKAGFACLSLRGPTRWSG
jgi:hypothetical protein